METKIPTLQAISVNPKLVLFCPKCTKRYGKKGQVLKRPKAIFHYHGNEENLENRTTHRISHCIDRDNYPNGYNIEINDFTERD